MLLLNGVDLLRSDPGNALFDLPKGEGLRCVARPRNLERFPVADAPCTGLVRDSPTEDDSPEGDCDCGFRC